ncbi:MAG TPA: hypothetical protein DDW50_18160 [Firmicutes bacterium]|jgi:hypothetical protein|nr:hypothetical protein [Bacillota bacterium]
MVTTYFYPAYLVIVFTLSLIFIPHKEYKEYLSYGFIVGGLGDMTVVGIFANLLHWMGFKNSGIFNVMGQNFLSPPCWTLSMMLFLYFLPRRCVFRYLYIFTFTAYSFGYGLLVHNSGLYDFYPWFYYIVSPLTFLGWWSFAAWLFLKTSPLAKIE